MSTDWCLFQCVSCVARGSRLMQSVRDTPDTGFLRGGRSRKQQQHPCVNKILSFFFSPLLLLPPPLQLRKGAGCANMQGDGSWETLEVDALSEGCVSTMRWAEAGQRQPGVGLWRRHLQVVQGISLFPCLGTLRQGQLYAVHWQGLKYQDGTSNRKH